MSSIVIMSPHGLSFCVAIIIVFGYIFLGFNIMFGALIKLTGSAIVVAAMSYMVYNFKRLDNERISDLDYEYNVEQIRREIKRQKKEKLKHRLLKFPKSSDIEDIKHFVLEEVKLKFISI